MRSRGNMENGWEELELYSSSDLAMRLLDDRDYAELTDAHGRYLSAHFVQARDYFRSSASSGFAARPVVLYYGVLSLTRALLLASGVGWPPTSQGQHGLTSREA